MIMNPDDTEAKYEGLGFNGKFVLALSDNKGTKIGNLSNIFSNMRFGLTLEYKYLNLKNTYAGSVEETSKHRGYAAGLLIRAGPLYLSGSYGFMKAKHEASGNISGISQYKYNPVNAEFGFLVPYGNIMELGATYGYSTATLKKTETNLSKDIDYKEQIIWLKAIFYFESR